MKNPFEDLAQVQRRINRILDDAFALAEVDSSGAALPGAWEPAVDLVETEGEFVALVELPGLTREAVALDLEGSRLVLSGQRPVDAGGSFQLMERSYGPFRRVFELGPTSDPEEISASFDDGVLTIRIPKRTETVRQIEVE